MTYTHTADQRRAKDMMGSDARHILLKGGARSGKTVIALESIIKRAVAAPESRHLVTRFRQNSLKAITGPTGSLNFVLKNAPGLDPGFHDRCVYKVQDDLLILPNKSEVWFGGLDDAKRVDKILGWEYATIYANEASMIPWLSFTTALTRLAQVAKLGEAFLQEGGPAALRQKLYIDCNPPPESHWIFRLFEKLQDPETKRPLTDPGAYTSILMNPEGNARNLDPKYLEQLRNLPERQRRRFYLGLYGDAGEAALWSSETIDAMRVLDDTALPSFIRTIVIVDPSGADDVEDATADEIGIMVMALGINGVAYVLEDLTMKGSPAEWGKVATDAYDRHEADCIVAETNYGGAMVKAVIQAAKPGVPYREVKASKGKHIRAEPVSALSEQGKLKLVGRFESLEDEMLAMTTAGYTGDRSPNRLDVMVWGATSLFPKIISQAKAINDQGFNPSQHAVTGSGGRGPRVNTGRGRWKRTART